MPINQICDSRMARPKCFVPLQCYIWGNSNPQPNIDMWRIFEPVRPKNFSQPLLDGLALFRTLHFCNVFLDTCKRKFTLILQRGFPKSRLEWRLRSGDLTWIKWRDVSFWSTLLQVCRVYLCDHNCEGPSALRVVKVNAIFLYFTFLDVNSSTETNRTNY